MTQFQDDLRLITEIQESDGPIVREIKTILAAGLHPVPVFAEPLDHFSEGDRASVEGTEGLFEMGNALLVRQAGVCGEIVSADRHKARDGAFVGRCRDAVTPRELAERHGASLSRLWTVVKAHAHAAMARANVRLRACARRASIVRST